MPNDKKQSKEKFLKSDMDEKPLDRNAIIKRMECTSNLSSLSLLGVCVYTVPDVFELVAKFCRNLTTVSIEVVENTDLDKFSLFTSGCDKVRHFEIIDRLHRFKNEHLLLVLSSPWSLTSLKLIGTAVTKASLTMLPNSLESLDIRSCKYLTVHAFNILRTRCPNLKSLKTSISFDQSKLDDFTFHWPRLESCIISTSQLLTFRKFCLLKELFLHCSAENVSINSILSELPQIRKLQLKISSAKDEVLYFDNNLKILIIDSDRPLAHNVILSLPYCAHLECLKIFGTDVGLVIRELLEKCGLLRYIYAPETTLDKYEFEKLTKIYRSRTIVVDIVVKDYPVSADEQK